jgi:hypothetical protein
MLLGQCLWMQVLFGDGLLSAKWKLGSPAGEVPRCVLMGQAASCHAKRQVLRLGLSESLMSCACQFLSSCLKMPRKWLLAYVSSPQEWAAASVPTNETCCQQPRATESHMQPGMTQTTKGDMQPGMAQTTKRQMQPAVTPSME